MLLQIKNYFTGERPPPPTRLHAMRSPRSRTEPDSAITSQSSGQIMKMSTSVDPFAPPKRNAIRMSGLNALSWSRLRREIARLKWRSYAKRL
jgi:hypothetical protein